jgi:hypothetical protein
MIHLPESIYVPLHLTQKHTDMELGVVWQPCPKTMDAGFSKAKGPPNPPKCEPVWFWEAEFMFLAAPIVGHMAYTINMGMWRQKCRTWIRPWFRKVNNLGNIIDKPRQTIGVQWSVLGQKTSNNFRTNNSPPVIHTVMVFFFSGQTLVEQVFFFPILMGITKLGFP